MLKCVDKRNRILNPLFEPIFYILGIHSKSEDSGICYPAKKFELSANFSKNATKWPKNGQK